MSKALKGFILSGPSGAGKITLAEIVLSMLPQYIERVITTTTRSPRKKDNGDFEEEGKDYYFVSKDRFCKEESDGKFFESQEVYGNYYGSYKHEVKRIWLKEKNPLFVIDVQGAQTLINTVPHTVSILIFPPNLKELEDRLKKRGDNPKNIQTRLQYARKEIVQAQHHFTYALVNDSLFKAKEELMDVICHEIIGTPLTQYTHRKF